MIAMTRINPRKEYELNLLHVESVLSSGNNIDNTRLMMGPKTMGKESRNIILIYLFTCLLFLVEAQNVI